MYFGSNTNKHLLKNRNENSILLRSSSLRMHVHLINKPLIEEFLTQNSRHRKAISTWLTTIKYANWSRLPDISDTFGMPKVSKDNGYQVVFELNTSNYIITCRYVFHVNRIHFFLCEITTQENAV